MRQTNVAPQSCSRQYRTREFEKNQAAQEGDGKVKRSFLTRWLAVGLMTLLVCGALSGVAMAQNFYSGKQLELLVPFAVGGGTDVWARGLVPFLQEELGDVRIQVANVPGAVIGVNEWVMRRNPTSGYTALISSGSTVVPYLLQLPQVLYDYKDFRAVIASPVGGVVYGSPSLGITRAADLRNTREPLIYGAIDATGNDLIYILAWEVLGLDVQVIQGYSSRGTARVAFERGETNIDYQTTPAYRANVEPLVEEGKAVPLFAAGMVDANGNVIRDPAFPDLPSIREVYVEMYGREPEGIVWDAYKAVLIAGQALQKVLFVHNDAPDEAYETLLAAARNMAQDPEFLAAPFLEGYQVYVGEEAQAAFNVAVQMTPETREWLRRFLEENYEVQL